MISFFPTLPVFARSKVGYPAVHERLDFRAFQALALP